MTSFHEPLHIMWLQSLAVVLLLSRQLLASPLVTSPAGQFQGLLDKDPQGRDYVAFRGIPYAKPPVGPLRFAKPQPADKIDGVFDATQGGSVCPIPAIYEQMISAEHGAEDCLLLNVYSKELSQGAPKKVMVFIHGGGYVVGSGKEYLVGNFVTSHDVIFVTINYRLGVLGFLSTGDDLAPGNYGLWDMRLALQWVKDNIASFGGDPNDVTISGESAGGSAVGYLSISPHTKGLFTKAYPQSGGPSSTFGNFMKPLTSTLKVAKALGCFEGEPSEELDSDSKLKVIECLRTIPADDFGPFATFGLDNVEFVPRVDKEFVPRPPVELLSDDKYLKDVGFFGRSYLVGLDNNENSIFETHGNMLKATIRQQLEGTEEEKDAVMSALVESAYANYISSRYHTNVPKEVVHKVMDWYERRFGNNSWGQMSGDLGFIAPTYDFINAASRGGAPVWLFYFNHYPAYMKGTYRGIVHGLDLSYWFDTSLAQSEAMLHAGIDAEIGMDEEDLKLKEQMSEIIAVFTQTGAPPTPLEGVTWPQYSMSQKSYLDLKPELEVGNSLGEPLRQLWLEDLPRWMEQGQGHRHQEL